MTCSIEVYHHPFGIKEYYYPNKFTNWEIQDIINYLEKKYYSTGNINPEAPGYQTPDHFNIFLEKKFKKLLETFLESVRKFVNDDEFIDRLNSDRYNMYSWCYMNWKSSGRSDNVSIWHIHNQANPNAVSGIFYLKLPKTPGGETKFHISGNKFELPSKELSWFLFPSNYIHAPGELFSTEKRYVISADIWF